MKLRRILCIGSLLCCGLFFSDELSVRVEATNYGDAIGKSIISAAIDQDKQKTWKPVAYPTDNFGIGTLYDGKGAGSFLCDTAKCLSLPDNSTATLKAHGFIGSGTGSSITLNDTQKRQLGLNLTLKILSLIGLSGKFDSSKMAVVTVEAPSATIRYLIKGSLSTQIKNQPPTPATTDAYNKRRIVAIAGDIIVDSLSATVKIDDSTSADVKASLDNNAGKVLGKDSSFEVSYSKSGTGTYTIKTAKAVIVAVQPEHEPKTGVLEGGTAPEWPSYTSMKLKTDE